MSRAVIVVATSLMLSGAPNLAFATEEGAAAGAVTGAIAGAVVGGPIGAVVGAVVGGVTVGAATGPSNQVQDQDALAEQPKAGASDPETTGTVVMERTCVRDADGTARCRRVR
jgi:phage tail tape-measure protein